MNAWVDLRNSSAYFNYCLGDSNLESNVSGPINVCPKDHLLGIRIRIWFSKKRLNGARARLINIHYSSILLYEATTMYVCHTFVNLQCAS